MRTDFTCLFLVRQGEEKLHSLTPIYHSIVRKSCQDIKKETPFGVPLKVLVSNQTTGVVVNTPVVLIPTDHSDPVESFITICVLLDSNTRLFLI